MKTMKSARAAAVILCLAMIFTLIPLMRPQEAHAIEVKGEIDIDISLKQKGFSGAAAKAIYWELMDSFEIIHAIIATDPQNTGNDIVKVDIDKNGKFDLFLYPILESGEVSRLFLEKTDDCSISDPYGITINNQEIAKYSEMGFKIVYERIWVRFVHQGSGSLEFRDNVTIDLINGSQTFYGTDAMAVSGAIMDLGNSNLVTLRQGSFQYEIYPRWCDLDKDGNEDISFVLDMNNDCSVTIEKLETCRIDDQVLRFDIPEDLLAEYAELNTDELDGAEIVYRSITFVFKEPPIAPPEISLTGAEVKLSQSVFTYNGKVQKPDIKTIGGMELIEGKDYKAEWSNTSSSDAGKYTITIRGIGDYTGGTKAEYKINKAMNPLSVKAKTAKVKFSDLKKKTQKLDISKVLKMVKKGQGIVTYTKSKGNKKITINKNTGKVTVKKGLKKGKYTVKVTVKAAGDKNYNAITKTVSFKIKVK